MSNSSTDQNLEDIDEFIIPNIGNKSRKIILNKSLFKGPAIEIYNYLMEDTTTNDKNDDISEEEYKKFEAKINQKEQIDEIKIVLFFLLYNDCDYDEKYYLLINSDRKIIAKRLVIQDYKINENKITFGKKRYIFISPIINKSFFSFKDGNKEIKIKKSRKGVSMIIEGKNLLKEKDFIKQNEQIIKNIEELKYKKRKKNNSNDNSKNEANEIKINFSNISSSNKSMSLTGEENFDLNQNQSESLSISSNSKQKDDSEKELSGDMFYDDNCRYIFNDDYNKEIDGIFSNHQTIKLNKKKIILEEGLKDLLSDIYDIDNDTRSHIIFKNFEEEQINKNEPFILEVKASMAELIDLLNQIKNISKIVKNIQGIKDDFRLPKCIIGIICRFDVNQIISQQKSLNYKIKDKTISEHIMEIIEISNVKVVIGSIKDEQIFGYSLGKPDYDKDIGRETRVDIFYMNTFLRKLDEKKVKEINDKYSSKYQSLALTKNHKINYDTLNKNYQDVQKRLKQSEKEKNELQQKLDQTLNYIKEKFGVEVNLDEIYKKKLIKND